MESRRRSGRQLCLRGATESAVGTALPGTSAVATLEDHAGRVAGGQQALVGGIEAGRKDVFAGEAVADMFPGRATVCAAERTFA